MESVSEHTGVGHDAVPGPVEPGQMAELLAAMRRDTEAAIARVVAGLDVEPGDAAAALESLRTAGEELRVVEAELWRQRDVLLAVGEFDDQRVPSARALLMDAPIPYLVTTTDGVILVANTAAAGLFGQPESRLRGRPLPAFNARRRGAVRHITNAVLRSERPVSAPFFVRVRGEDRITRATVKAHRRAGQDPVLSWALAPMAAVADPYIEELANRGTEASHEATATSSHQTETSSAATEAEQRVDIEDQGAVMSALVEMSETPLADLPERTLAGLAAAAVKALTADGGSVTELRPASIGATDDDVRTADRVQYEHQLGPCVTAVTQRHPQYSPDITADDRWAAMGSVLAAASGFHSILAVPLAWDEKVLGVLNIYARRAYAFDTREQGIAEVLAGPAAAMLYHAQTVREAREKNQQLARAMQTRATIEQAKAILMVEHGITLDEAFETLTRYSQQRNRKLYQVASDIVASASPHR